MHLANVFESLISCSLAAPSPCVPCSQGSAPKCVRVTRVPRSEGQSRCLETLFKAAVFSAHPGDFVTGLCESSH